MIQLPTLKTRRCTLRPWHENDIPLLPPIANTRDISWNTSYNFPYPYNIEQAEAWIHHHQDGTGERTWHFAVLVDKALVGGCGAYRGTDVQSHTAEIGYWLGVKYWGKGLASEMVEALVQYMTTETDVEQLTANVYGWNPASARVLQKTGFTKEGVRKGVVRKWGKQTDLMIFGKLLEK